MSNNRIKLATAPSGVPVYMHDLWEMSFSDNHIIIGASTIDGYLVTESQSSRAQSWPISTLIHPTRFNGLNLEWREGWKYPVVEIRGAVCAVKLPGVQNDCKWPAWIWQYEGKHELLPFDTISKEALLACPLSKWCERCQRPNAACDCQVKPTSINDIANLPDCDEIPGLEQLFTIHQAKKEIDILTNRVELLENILSNSISDSMNNTGESK